MRKSLLLFFVAALTLFRAGAQNASTYIFTPIPGTYTPITGTIASGVHADDVTQTSIPIGFNFQFCGTSYNTISACSNGFISFANTTLSTLTNDISTVGAISPCLMPLWDDLGGQQPTPTAQYTTTGAAPNRVFTFQWSSWRWTYSGVADVISFQVKLYETTGIIQYIYSQGPNATTSPSATIGIARNATDYQTLNNSSTAPLASSTTFTVNIGAKPATGQIYQWSPPNPCTGKPTAGVVSPVIACPGANFNLSLINTGPIVSGLTYQWEYLNNTGIWLPIIPGNTSVITYSITQPTSVRAIVTCSNSGLSDTTAPYLITLAPFYYCYCGSNSSINSTLSTNIGNVTINTQPGNATVLNNGTGTPVLNNTSANKQYTDFRTTVSAPCLYRDSLYKMFVTQINQASFYASTVTAFIDYNRDGTFNIANPNERLFSKNTAAATNPISDTFRVPANAQIGTTGMRVIIQYGTGLTINPCGTYNYGETEDYLVNICYPPCNGPTNAGIAETTDTVVCPGYTVDLTDTTHEVFRSGLAWVWQQSNNGGFSFTNVPNSAGKDTLNDVLVTGPVQYRFRMICSFTGDTTYSNVINITNGSNFQCYPVSQPTGNKQQDSSDIGSFSIGNYIMPIGMTAGPHVKNPLANRRHTNNTQPTKWIHLTADSTYPMAIYHTLKSDNHGDALVSVFMDFNNDLQYNALFNSFPYSPERVFTGVSTLNPATWYMTGSITIPNAVVPETPTGLRVIINSDLNPNAAANLGAGNYISGETEDYVVVFHRYDPTKVSSTGLVKDVTMYPNPTEGRVSLAINSSKDIAKLDVMVTTLPGQTVLSRTFSHTGTQFSTDLNLTGYASGVYLVEVRADGDRLVRKLVIR